MRMLKWFRHLFCRDVRWSYPDLAALDVDRRRIYPLSCCECGYSKPIEAGLIRDALERRNCKANA